MSKKKKFHPGGRIGDGDSIMVRLSPGEKIHCRDGRVYEVQYDGKWILQEQPQEFVPQAADSSLLRYDFPNQHVWVMHAVFRLDQSQIIEMHANKASVSLGNDRLAMTTPVICHRCEMPWLIVHKENCPGTPSETILAEVAARLKEVDPHEE